MPLGLSISKVEYTPIYPEVAGIALLSRYVFEQFVDLNALDQDNPIIHLVRDLVTNAADQRLHVENIEDYLACEKLFHLDRHDFDQYGKYSMMEDYHDNCKVCDQAQSLRLDWGAFPEEPTNFGMLYGFCNDVGDTDFEELPFWTHIIGMRTYFETIHYFNDATKNFSGPLPLHYTAGQVQDISTFFEFIEPQLPSMQDLDLQARILSTMKLFKKASDKHQPIYLLQISN